MNSSGTVAPMGGRKSFSNNDLGRETAPDSGAAGPSALNAVERAISLPNSVPSPRADADDVKLVQANRVNVRSEGTEHRSSIQGNIDKSLDAQNLFHRAMDYRANRIPGPFGEVLLHSAANAEALRLLKLAAGMNHADSANQIFMMHLQRVAGLSDAEQEQWDKSYCLLLLPFAEKSNPTTQCILARLLIEERDGYFMSSGEGRKCAKDLAGRAIREGELLGYSILGWLEATERGGSYAERLARCELAEQYFEIALASGDREAAYNLGILYRSGAVGLNLEPSVRKEQAKEYFKQAAEVGLAYGQYGLAKCLLELIDEERGRQPASAVVQTLLTDYQEALDLLQAAADQGHLEARKRLSEEVEWDSEIVSFQTSDEQGTDRERSDEHTAQWSNALIGVEATESTEEMNATPSSGENGWDEQGGARTERSDRKTFAMESFSRLPERKD